MILKYYHIVKFDANKFIVKFDLGKKEIEIRSRIKTLVVSHNHSFSMLL